MDRVGRGDPGPASECLIEAGDYIPATCLQANTHVLFLSNRVGASRCQPLLIASLLQLSPSVDWANETTFGWCWLVGRSEVLKS